MEYLNIVTENNELTGKIEDRKIIHEKGLWHREVSIWILNEKSELLIQKRAATKKIKPNKWGVTAGHVDPEENPIETAKRETLEEIGLELKDKMLEFLFLAKIEAEHNNHFKYIYYVKTNKEISDFTIQEEELSELKYISFETFENVIKKEDEEYTFSKGKYIPKLIDMLKNKEGIS